MPNLCEPIRRSPPNLFAIAGAILTSLFGEGHAGSYSKGYGPNPVLTAPAPPVEVRGPVVIGWPEGGTPTAPPNFTVQAFMRNIESPRWLLAIPNGDVLVAQSNFGVGVFGSEGPGADSLDALIAARMLARSPNIVALLRDTDGDGVSDLRFILSDELDHPFGLALISDKLYVAATDAIWRFDFRVGRTYLERKTKIVDLPAGPVNPHWTRTLLVSPDERRLYVTVGSVTDVDLEDVDRGDPHRAAILEVNLETNVVRAFATGLRNASGLDWEPHLGRMWTVVNERDHLGPDLPPDFFTEVEDGTFYGWPYAYHGANEDPGHAGRRPDLVRRSRKPDYALGAHTAPLGLAFQKRTGFPEEFRHGAFISQRGSMRADPWSGPRVLFIPFARGRPTGPPVEFLGGFVADAEVRTVHGRPAGIAQLQSGQLLVADDAGDCIWLVSPRLASR